MQPWRNSEGAQSCAGGLPCRAAFHTQAMCRIIERSKSRQTRLHVHVGQKARPQEPSATFRVDVADRTTRTETVTEQKLSCSCSNARHRPTAQPRPHKYATHRVTQSICHIVTAPTPRGSHESRHIGHENTVFVVCLSRAETTPFGARHFFRTHVVRHSRMHP